MLNKLHPFRRYTTNSGKNLKICLTHFDPRARALCPCLTLFPKL